MTLRSSALDAAINSKDLLSDKIRKMRNNAAFKTFLNNKIDFAKQAVKPLLEEKHVEVLQINDFSGNQNGCTELKTEVAENNVIRTEEMCYVPYPFVQSETLLYPDGTKIITTFYPNGDKIPAKRVEYSAQSTIKKVTTFDKYGKEKTMERVIRNADGSGIEEKIDYKYSRKVVKHFNNQNIARYIYSYVKDKLAFKMECDDLGNIQKEYIYSAFAPNELLQKEILYNANGSYTTKEYAANGVVYSVYTTFDRKMNKVLN